MERNRRSVQKMTGRPLVSIVTPTFNPGPRLKRCIASVSDQSYPTIEHIVVDGGSLDGTVDLLERTPGVRYLSEPDEGQADAINKGFAMASGDLLGWLNADDILTPTAVASVVRAFEKDPEIGWTIGDVVVVTEDGATRESPGDVNRPFSWAARNIAAQPGTFTARWAIEAVGALDVTLHYMMDLDLWLRLIDRGIRHAYIDEVLAVFEVHEESKSGSLSHAVFLLDDCAARMKSGRFDQAAFSLGRALAWGLEPEGDNPESSLRSQLDRLDPSRTKLAENIARQGFLVEQAVLAAKEKSPRGLRLLDPRLWSRMEARARLWDLLRRAASQRKRRRDGATYATLLTRDDR